MNFISEPYYYIYSVPESAKLYGRSDGHVSDLLISNMLRAPSVEEEFSDCIVLPWTHLELFA